MVGVEVIDRNGVEQAAQTELVRPQFGDVVLLMSGKSALQYEFQQVQQGTHRWGRKVSDPYEGEDVPDIGRKRRAFLLPSGSINLLTKNDHHIKLSVFRRDSKVLDPTKHRRFGELVLYHGSTMVKYPSVDKSVNVGISSSDVQKYVFIEEAESAEINKRLKIRCIFVTRETVENFPPMYSEPQKRPYVDEEIFRYRDPLENRF